MKQLATRRS